MPTDTTVAPAEPAAEPSPGPANPARRRRRTRLIGSYIILTVAAIVILFPIYISVVDSLLKSDQLGHQPPPFFPLDPQWNNYSVAWNQGGLSGYLKNSSESSLKLFFCFRFFFSRYLRQPVEQLKILANWSG